MSLACCNASLPLRRTEIVDFRLLVSSFDATPAELSPFGCRDLQRT